MRGSSTRESLRVSRNVLLGADTEGMDDALTGRYTCFCLHAERVRATLSSFRHLQRLPGAAHPAVYRVRFGCGCGDEHTGLLAHDELDWAPLGAAAGVFLDLMTSRLADAGAALADAAATRLRSGEWPWSFYCYPEGRARPVFPSSFVAVAPGERALRLAVRCPARGALRSQERRVGKGC